jgi:hypothetical protein
MAQLGIKLVLLKPDEENVESGMCHTTQGFNIFWLRHS